MELTLPTEIAVAALKALDAVIAAGAGRQILSALRPSEGRC